MTFEHCALNVPDAKSAAAWYVANLGLQVKRAQAGPPHTHFLADDSGRVFLEIYSNPTDRSPDYAAQHPLRMHLGFAVSDARSERARLEAVGATLAVEEPQPDGSLLIMMRDPWGIPVQLCQRRTPFEGR